MQRGTDVVSHRIAPHVAWQDVDGEAVVVDLDSGVSIGLNPTATFVWKNLEQCDDAELVTRTAREFEVDSDTAAADVRAFIEEIERRRLVERQ